jgi:hypothetical protein
MTIIDAKVLLFNYFSKNDVLNLEESFKIIIPISISEPIDRSILRAALKEMEESKLIKDIATVMGIRDIWVLTAPLNSYSQTLVLNYPTLAALTAIMSQIAEQLKNPSLVVDPLNLKEIDLQNLLVVVDSLIKNK